MATTTFTETLFSSVYFLKINDVVRITTLSESTIYRLIKKREFPTSISVGNSKMWLASEINAWILKTAGARNEN